MMKVRKNKKLMVSPLIVAVVRGMAPRRNTIIMMTLRRQRQYQPYHHHHHVPTQQRLLVTITHTKATTAAQSQRDDSGTELPQSTFVKPPLSTPQQHVSQQQQPQPKPVVLLTITNACWDRIRELNQRSITPTTNPCQFLRIVVDAGGCSGFSYQFELDDTIQDDDYVITRPTGTTKDDADDETTTTKVVVDPDSMQLIQGSTIDYEVSMMKSAFKVVENPQSESACGCGSSFAIKKFASNPALD